MGALGNLLSIPALFGAGPIRLDLSSLPIMLAGVAGGPLIGCLTGFVSGLLASYVFGPAGHLGALGISLSIGKALHGLGVGLLSKALKPLEKRHQLPWSWVCGFFGLLPELLWITILFVLLVPLFIPNAMFMGWAAASLVSYKACLEVGAMALIAALLLENRGVRELMLSAVEA